MVYAYYIFHKQRRFPNEYFALPFHERAAVAAFIDEKQRRDRIEAAKQKLKSKTGGSGGRRSGRRGR